MAIAVTVNEVVGGDSLMEVFGTIVPSGTYPGSGGETLNLSLSSAQGLIVGKALPLFVNIWGQAGFVYQYTFGTTISNGKFTVYCNTAGGSNAALGEHTNAAYAAGVSGDTIKFRATFRNLGVLA